MGKVKHKRCRIDMTCREFDSIFFAEDTLIDLVEGWADEEYCDQAIRHIKNLRKLMNKYKRSCMK